MPVDFRPESYGETCSSLLQAVELTEIRPGTPRRELRPQLEALTPSSVLGGRVPTDESMARCCISGLWLLHNFLDESHQISQHIESPSGSFWHAIMHRREPDYANAKYWFRRVGSHPVMAEMGLAAREIAAAHPDDPASARLSATSWDPAGFVDLCESAARGKLPSEQLCRRVATAEWQLLFDYCYRHALAPTR